VSEKDFAEKTSIKTLEELQTQTVHLGSSKNIEFGEFDIQMDEISDIPKPHYPLLSKRLREQGDVLVRSCIRSGGKSNVVTIDKSSGYHRLDQSALDAVKHWKELLKNRIQRSSLRCYRIPIRFRLTGE
jgi:TonB family protein